MVSIAVFDSFSQGASLAENVFTSETNGKSKGEPLHIRSVALVQFNTEFQYGFCQHKNS